MIKNKYLAIGGGSLAVAAGLGIAFFVWRGTNVQKVQVDSAVGETRNSNESVELTQPSSVDSVPLGGNSEPRPSNASSGLRVANGGVTDLGQLGSNIGSSNGQPSSSNGSSSSSGSRPASSPFDPATFAQYDKYKPDKAALFGEVQAGTGAELTANKKAAVYYKGWLTDGRLFDESKPDSSGKMQPFVFTLGAHQVIPGWEQALAGMKVGGVRLLIVPPEVGYGATGQNPIPPNAVLIFQVQLVAVE